MKIIVGQNAGFCYGVKRAVEGAEKIAETTSDIYCLGELVHNKEVLKKLEKKGIKFIENLDTKINSIIIRAHGVSKDIYKFLETNKINYYDYTCPNVLNIHKIACEYVDKGYFIFLLGDKKHPENIGTISYCGENSLIIENLDDVETAIKQLEDNNINKLLIIAQTTFSLKLFENIVQNIEKNIKNVDIVIKNTICNATEIRQKETEELAQKVHFMIIIGGKNSSNTKKLFDIASANCENTICIENKSQLDIEKIKKFNVVGIMAGASTPQSSIDEVRKELEKII